MRRQLLPALRVLLILTVVTGVIYPLAITAVAHVAFGDRANGSLVTDARGRTVGSRLIGQSFTGAQWFHPRPSAAGDGYDGAASGPSNLGPTNPELLTLVKDRVAAYRRDNGLAATAPVPVDAVTASGSGLDPLISIANARLQVPRVARARHLSEATVRRLVDEHTQGRTLGIFGEPGVNVVTLNLALSES